MSKFFVNIGRDSITHFIGERAKPLKRFINLLCLSIFNGKHVVNFTLSRHDFVAVVWFKSSTKRRRKPVVTTQCQI